jgi:hypothetical protein
MLLPLASSTDISQTTSRVFLGDTQPSEVAKLSWLAGCWAQRAGTRLTEEHWMAPIGGTMVGMSRSSDAGVVKAWEALRIVTEGAKVSYLAQPNGGAPTAFPATTLNDSMAVFDNPAHDFPQRIAYRRVNADSVVATISATRDGRTRGQNIPMGRVRCGA